MNSQDVIADDYSAPMTHAELKAMVQNFHTTTAENNTECRKDRAFYDGDQIDGKTLAILKRREQPPTVINRVAPAINGMLGVLDAASSDPRAYPRTPRAGDAAEVATKTLNYLADATDFENVKAEASHDFLIEGTCAVFSEFEDAPEGVTPEIPVRHIRWEEFIYDPNSRKTDFSDAIWLGYGKLMDRHIARSLYGDVISLEGPELEDSYTDNQPNTYWTTENRKLVRIVDIYYRDGATWHRAIFTESEEVYSGVSGYEDDRGRSMCPIVAASYEIDQHGNRYGAIRQMRPLQNLINSTHSKLLHNLNSRQLRQIQDQVPNQDERHAKEEAAKPDGIIPWGYEIASAPDLAQGQMLSLQNAFEALDRLAPTPALLGRMGGANESGRARQILQQAGYTELARAYSRFAKLENSVYRHLWFIARQHLSAPIWIRIADDERAPEFLQVNEPIMGMVQQPLMDPETQQPIIDPMTGQPVVQLVEGVVGYNNRLAELEMEIVLSTVADTVTLQKEAFDSILEMSSALKLDPLDPRFELLIEMSSMPNKRETVEKLQAFRQQLQQQQQPDPIAQQTHALEIEAKEAEIERDRAKAFKDIASARETQVQAVRKGFGLD